MEINTGSGDRITYLMREIDFFVGAPTTRWFWRTSPFAINSMSSNEIGDRRICPTATGFSGSCCRDSGRTGEARWPSSNPKPSSPGTAGDGDSAGDGEAGDAVAPSYRLKFAS